MELKRHHKIIIGGASSIVLIFIIVSSLFMYFIYTQMNMNYASLNQKISNLQTDTQSKMNVLSKSISDTQQSLQSLGSQVGSINNSISYLKASASSDFSGIIENVVKSVVTVRTDVAQGSGFIITSDGYIVTNAHVMQGASAANIITSDGSSHPVKLIGQDTNMDIALLKIDGTYTPLTLADSDNINVGEKVIAIGNPLGLQFSVTEGIVSAVNRPGANGLNYYVQTDASLNPGNSGGPLIDVTGKAIGINNFKIGSGENLGFALESNYIKQTINSISQNQLQKNLL
ncbi:MAG TPA: trypsin-like peptidase domain-containing protein [Patescibacteria group bacterium]|nr:trypsin-like peptidase domain-containing protein [Patescibacteria group bacterium]